MNPEKLRERIPVSELIFSTSRSGGPGGQNVNKVNTKVELRFRVAGSTCLTEKEKEKILYALKNKINSIGELIIVSQSERTQLMNRKKAEEKFFKIIAEALTERPQRRKTLRTKVSDNERLDNKKKHSTIKKLRNDQRINGDE